MKNEPVRYSTLIVPLNEASPARTSKGGRSIGFWDFMTTHHIA